MKFNIDIPNDAKYILDKLSANGYEAFVVGGCVRDAILGREPHDWDICTSAIPTQTIKVFSDERTIETGLQHGTITVMLNDVGYEITTYRQDGDYSDNRRPDNVVFVTDINKDLSRRDFTINAMAYNSSVGLIDPFKGYEDLQNKIIRCVGNAEDRFKEDGLRIMRAIRFACQLGFFIEENTDEAIHKHKELLNNIAKERICSELCKSLCYDSMILYPFSEFKDVIGVIIPEFKPCFNFNQNNPYHIFDVYSHILHATNNICTDDLIIKLTLLFHDIGKPNCYSEDEKGGHFYGHGVVSADITKEVLTRLRFDNDTLNKVVELVLYHDSTIEPTEKVAKRWLNKVGKEQLYRLIKIRKCDILAHSTYGNHQERYENQNKLYEIVNKVLEEEQCFQLKDLAINGKDLISIGYKPGKELGNVLNSLLDRVINNEIENTKDGLLEYIKGGNLV